jgi:trehalose 6-phosphate synthase
MWCEASSEPTDCAIGDKLIFSGDLQSTADAIHTALTMTEEAKKSNWEKLFAVSWRFYA